MSRWKQFNPNPMNRSVGDCAVRAVSIALGIDWEQAFALLAKNAYQMGDMPSSNAVISATLRQNGFYRQSIPNSCPDCYTADDFLQDHPAGVYVFGFGNHVATAIDGCLYDTWDSRKEIPMYVFYRKDDVH